MSVVALTMFSSGASLASTISPNSVALTVNVIPQGGVVPTGSEVQVMDNSTGQTLVSGHFNGSNQVGLVVLRPSSSTGTFVIEPVTVIVNLPGGIQETHQFSISSAASSSSSTGTNLALAKAANNAVTPGAVSIDLSAPVSFSQPSSTVKALSTTTSPEVTCSTGLVSATTKEGYTHIATQNEGPWANEIISVTDHGYWDLTAGYSTNNSNWSANGTGQVDASGGASSTWGGITTSGNTATRDYAYINYKHAEYYDTCSGYFYEIFPTGYVGGAGHGSPFTDSNNGQPVSEVTSGADGLYVAVQTPDRSTEFAASGWSWSAAFSVFGFGGSATEGRSSNETLTLNPTTTNLNDKTYFYTENTNWAMAYTTQG